MIRELCFVGIYLAEALIALQYFDAIYQRKRALLWVGIIFSAGYSCLLFTSSMNSVWLNGAAFFTVNFVILKTVYQCSARATAFHSAILICVMSGAEMCVLALLGIAFSDFIRYEKDFLVLLLLIVLSKLLYFILTRICIRIVRRKRTGPEKDGFVEILLCLAPISSTLVLVAMIYIGITGGLNETARIFVIISSPLLLISNIIVFIVHEYNRELSAKYYVARLALQKDQTDKAYYELLKEQYENQRVLIHDIRNHLHTVYDLAEEKELEKIKSYVSTLANTPALQRRMRFCRNLYLNSIFTLYSERCKNEGIDFDIDIREEAIEFMEASDLTVLFGNLLENALEATRMTDEKKIEVGVITKIDQKITEIKVRNSCAQKPKSDSFGNLVTSKRDKENHGVGLKSISRVVGKYDGKISQHYFESESEFQTVICLKHPKNLTEKLSN